MENTLILIYDIISLVLWLLTPNGVCFADAGSGVPLPPHFSQYFLTTYAAQLYEQYLLYLRQFLQFKKEILEQLPVEYQCAANDQALMAYVRHLLEVDMRLVRFFVNVYWGGGDWPRGNNNILHETWALHFHLIEETRRFFVRHPLIAVDPVFFDTALYLLPEMTQMFHQLSHYRHAVIEIDYVLVQLEDAVSRFDRMLINFVDSNMTSTSAVEQIRNLALTNRTPKLDAQFGELSWVRRQELKGLIENYTLAREQMARTYMQYTEMAVWAHEMQTYYLYVPKHELSARVGHLFSPHTPYYFQDSKQAIFTVSQENLRFLLEAHDPAWIDYNKSVYDKLTGHHRETLRDFNALVASWIANTAVTGPETIHQVLQRFSEQNELLAKYLIGEIDTAKVQKLLNVSLDQAIAAHQNGNKQFVSLQESIESIKTARQTWHRGLMFSPDKHWWYSISRGWLANKPG